MISLVDITFHANTEYTDTNALVKAQSVSLIYVETLRQKMDIEVIKHINNPQTIIHELPGYKFFRTGNSFFNIPVATMIYLTKRKPDIILVQGLIFPIQVLALRLFLGKKVKILLNHHADRPFTSLKRFIQKIADSYIDQYLFSSYGNAAEWVESGQIKSYEKITQLPPTLTWFYKKHKTICRQQLQMDDELHYIWVGRLNENKDPVTLLTGFEKLLQAQPLAKLHLIYQSTDLLVLLKEKIANSDLLKNAIYFEGYVPNEELITWYNAADFFISTSHMEGGSVSILEAMSCGCIPIVTSIPASMKTIGDGKYGFYFTPGNADQLYKILMDTACIDQSAFSQNIENYFNEELSVEAVGKKFYSLCSGLSAK